MQGFSYGFAECFGLMFNDFFKSLGATTKSITMISSSFSFACSFTALFGSAFQKKFPLRYIAIFGGTMYFLGSFLTVFAQSIEHLMFTHGFMRGKRIYSIAN